MSARSVPNASAGPSTPRRLVGQQGPYLGSPESGHFPRSSLSPSSLGPSPFASTFSSPSVFSSANASVDYFGTPSGGDLSHSTVASSVPTASPAKLAGRTIESVSVPHFSKSGKQWLFACRVVPAGSEPGPASGQRQRLGKMSPAGDSEPHTVWRSWQDFLDFAAECVHPLTGTYRRADRVPANSLLLAFPDERPNSASPATRAPSVPRLASRATLFTTRATLVRRQEDLELFCRQLFSLPADVRESTLVRNFFQVGLEDRLGALSLRENLLIRPVLPKFASVDDADGLALKPPRSLRPTLAIKTSSRDLRTAINEFDDDGPRSRAPSPLAWTEADATRTALLFQREHGSRAEELRTTPRSTSSSIPPPALSSRSSPLLGATVPSRAATPTSSASFAKTLRKKASGHLKHFRSLGDLRGASKKSLPPIPTESVPALPAPFAAFPQSSQPPAMHRANTQPVVSKSAALPPTPLEATHRPAPLSATSAAGTGRVPSAPTSAPLPGRHRRTGSTMSSTSSIEDLWGSPFPQFRQTPSGRVEYVRPEELARSAESRRQSASFVSAQPQRVPSTGSQGRARPAMPRPGRHVSSASISSIDSARSSISSASGRSLAMSLSRSSGGGSDGYTPPTPQMEWTTSLGSGGEDIRQQALAGKYSVEQEVRYENNMVPPPPFFVSARDSLAQADGFLQLTRFHTQPVPPAMGSAGFGQRTPRTSDASLGRSTYASHDKTPATPRSRSGSGASISSSCRRFSNTGPFALDADRYYALESIQDSPVHSSAASTPRTIDGASSYWTFKFLHRDENIVLRVPRPDEPEHSVPILSDLRAEIRSKFRACGVDLPADGGEAEWGLAWTPRGQPGAVRLVVSQTDLDACIVDFVDGPGRGKLVMRIIC